MDQRSSSRLVEDQGTHQLDQSAGNSGQVWRTTGLMARVKGGDSSGLIPSEVLWTSEPSRDWCDRDVNERLEDYSILTQPGENLAEESSARPLVNMSESMAMT